MDKNKKFCLKLYYLRTREKKMTQKKVATQLAIRQATLSNLEQGSSMPSLDILLKLCQFYNVTPTWLLDDKAPLVPTPNDRWTAREKVRGKAGKITPAEERKLAAAMQEELKANAQRRRGYKTKKKKAAKKTTKKAKRGRPKKKVAAKKTTKKKRGRPKKKGRR